MMQTFVVDIAASICPPLTKQEVQDAILHAMFQKERTQGMGSMKIEVEQTFGTVAHPYHFAAGEGWLAS